MTKKNLLRVFCRWLRFPSNYVLLFAQPCQNLHLSRKHPFDYAIRKHFSNNLHALRAQQNMKMRALIIVSAIFRLGLKP